jgi:ribosomal protein L3 glutamine methyltransferase
VKLAALIDEAATRLDAAGVAFGHGTTNAQDEAAWLALWRLDLDWGALETLDDIEVDAEGERAVRAVIDERIATRRPAAFITGEAWLQGLPFFADARSLVPRSLIAEPLMDGTLTALLGAPPARVLDLCTGNGSLAVLAALAWPDATVDASDIDTDALALAERNVQRHGVQARVRLLAGDGVTPVQGLGPYDVVLCNPPYVNAQSMAALPPEYQAEPALALAGGRDGMDFIRALLPRLPSLLAAPEAALVLEVGHERAHFEAAFRRLAPLWLDTAATQGQLLLLTREQLHAAFAR